MTRLLRCKCSSKFQDEEHGKKLRVHNFKEAGVTKWRCTVCNKER